MDALKKLPLPWIIVSVLVLVVIVMMFQQRRSGYTPTSGAVITMMDLEEFSAFSPEQKAHYVNNLAAYQPRLSLSTDSITNYKMILDEVMTNSMPMSTPTPTPTPTPSSKCPPGQFSPTGSQPGCMPCPENTYCPLPGTITPTNCPYGFTSPNGSIMATSCVQSSRPSPQSM